jgi:hypothetical protein
MPRPNLRVNGLPSRRPEPTPLVFSSAVAPAAIAMTSQGTAHGRFQRAIRRRHLTAAEMAARELRGLNLAEAPDLTLLIRETDRWRYERAAVRWLERVIEERPLPLTEIVLAGAALADVGGAGDGSLRELLRSRPRNRVTK